MQLIEQERSEAEILLQRSVSHPHDAALLADPRLFLRKWIAEVPHRCIYMNVNIQCSYVMDVEVAIVNPCTRNF